MEPLEAETLEEREQDGIVCRVVRYRIGRLKGAPATMVGFDAFPEGGTKLQGVLQIHGPGPVDLGVRRRGHEHALCRFSLSGQRWEGTPPFAIKNTHNLSEECISSGVVRAYSFAGDLV